MEILYLVVSDDEIVKVHIHSEQPGDALNYGQRYGELINIKIENMRMQHTTIVEGEQESRQLQPLLKIVRNMVLLPLQWEVASVSYSKVLVHKLSLKADKQ